MLCEDVGLNDRAAELYKEGKLTIGKLPLVDPYPILTRSLKPAISRAGE